MDYCDECDGAVILRNFGGVMNAYCTDCEKYIDANPNFKETERIKSSRSIGVDWVGLIKCPYCNWELQEESNIEYYLDIHLSEEHIDESEVINASIDDLIKIAAKSEYSKIAKMALDKLEDDEDLMEVYEKSRDWQIRKNIVKRINNQKILEQILLKDRSFDVRMSALKKINNIETLDRVINQVDDEFKMKIEKQKEILKKYG